MTIFRLKCSNVLLLLISIELVLPVLKDLPMFCEILIFSCFEVIPTYDAEHSLQVYL